VPRTTNPLVLVDPVGNLALSAAPQETRIDQKWYDGTGSVRQQTFTTFQYDDLGNVVRILDAGETEWPDDDLIAEITYSSCRGTTWVSVPATYRAIDALTGEVMRERDGSKDLCANAVVTELIEKIDGTTQAVTNLFFDAYGSYNRIEYPANASGQRFTVDYVFDADRNTDVVQVTDSHGLTAMATYDWSTGLPASRTDANGHTTTYTYDPLGRVASITGPYEQGTGNATVSFEYFPTAPNYAYAVGRHFDAFNPGDTIDTVVFIDGQGRETQTKQDATIFRAAGLPAEDVMVVSGAVTYDGLGRPVRESHPFEEPLGKAGIYNGDSSPYVTTMAWDLRDRVTAITRPDGAVTSTAYTYGDAGFGAQLFVTATTDPLGKTLTAYSDGSDNVFGMFESAGGLSNETRYAYDVLDQLIRVTDNAGNQTALAYDMLGRRVSVDTPDSGLREYTYDAAGNLVVAVDPVSRAAGQQVTYEYDFERLTDIRYQDGTPDVHYTYGAAGAPGNGAGRVVATVDGATDRVLTYDPLGLVASETNTMLVHNLNEGIEERLTFETSFTYDGFGRLATMTYPDGEVVRHDYDSGGLLRSVAGEKAGHLYPYVDRLEYDEFNDRRFVRYGNGVETAYEYDPMVRWLGRINTVTPAREVQDLVYTYDAVGNVLEADNQLPKATTELMGGPSTQTYTYDALSRLVRAMGTADVPPNKVREYELTLAYDAAGNIVSKSQLDEIANSNGRNRIRQHFTTYDIDFEYSGAGPHQTSRIGSRPYTYDDNGNFTGWTDDETGQNRSITWDAEDRVTSVADQGSTTTYRYDDAGRLAIERGPGGETSFVNRWYTVRNGTVAWKHIFAGDQRVATQRAFSEGEYEHMRYFLHQDLQGSTNIVTDDLGQVFQRIGYFAAGEIWIHEHSDIHRTPYLYGDGYLDEFRDIINLRERWYDPREQYFYSPDPVLFDDPDDVIADPALLPAYTYAQSNPLSLVDRDGRAPQLARHRLGNGLRSLAANAGPAASAAPDPTDSDGRSSRLQERTAKAPPDSTRGKIQSFAEALDAKPLLKFTFEKTQGSEDGWSLTKTEISPLFAGPSITFPRPTKPADGSTSGPSADTGAPQPGTGGAAALAGGTSDLSQPTRERSDATVGGGSSAPPAHSGAP
jgi:RHS repeat-associated protein